MLGENINYNIQPFNHCYEELFSKFDCGNEELNKYLYKADKDYNDGLGVTKLIIDMDKEKLIGYYTICTSALLYSMDDNKIRSIPSAEIKNFALDIEYHGMNYSDEIENYNLSDYLFLEMIENISNLSEEIGMRFIILNAVPRAINFYKANYFAEYGTFMIPSYDRYTEGCQPMYMLIE